MDDASAGPWRSVSALSVLGMRGSQEDRVAIQSYREGRVGVICVFDGHGGDHVSEKLRTDLPGHLERTGALDAALQVRPRTPVSRALKRLRPLVREAFAAVDDDLGVIGDTCGSTAVVAIVTDVAVILCQVGDSYAVIASEEDGRVLAHTESHAVGCSDAELDRIHKHEDVFVSLSIARLPTGSVRAGFYASQKSSSFSLGMTRAIGDHDLRFVVPVPDVTLFMRPSTDKNVVLILASDGLTDGYADEKVGADMPSAMTVSHSEVVADTLSSSEFGVSDLIKKATSKPGWCGDNTTAVIARL